ncbi:XRE family transcriptional regulator, partial [Neisseria sicca]|uniref:XRE family transcriptional regulator n=1 Tax=Neisseria sicca TaxID=490 RepID=UPI0011BD0734
MRWKRRDMRGVGGNVFGDLGFEREEGGKLKGDRDMIMRRKLEVGERVRGWIKEEKLKEEEGGEMFKRRGGGVWDLVKGKMRKLRIDGLLRMVGKRGKRGEL